MGRFQPVACQQVGNYLLRVQFGAGGMGIVFRAEDLNSAAWSPSAAGVDIRYPAPKNFAGLSTWAEVRFSPPSLRPRATFPIG